MRTLVRPCHTRLFVGLALIFVFTISLSNRADAQSATLKVEPSSGLADGDLVTVSSAVSLPRLTQCRADATSLSQCNSGGSRWTPGDPHGNGRSWTIEMIVWREIDTEDGLVDCAIVDCAFFLTPGQRFHDNVTAALSFDAGAPLIPRPTLSVTPASDLLDGQEVILSGANFDPFQAGAMRLCIDGGQFSCARLGEVTSEADGTFERAVELPRVVSQHGSQGVDCAVYGCFLFVAEYQQSYRLVRPVPVAFDPAIPLPDGPPLTVVPDVALIDGQELEVTFETENTELRTCVMVDGTISLANCTYANLFDYTRTEEGLTTAKVQIRRVVRLGSHGRNNSREFDCALEQCALVVASYGDTPWSISPISFDADATLPKASVKLRKRNGLAEGDVLKIQVANTFTNSVEVRQCPRDATTHEDNRCAIIANHYRQGAPNRSLDRFRVVALVRRYVGARNGDGIDCAAEKACDLRVFGADGPMRRLLINLAPADAPEVPQMKVSTKRDLTDRQSVVVTIRNPSESTELRQCITVDGQRPNCRRLRQELVKQTETVLRVKVPVYEIIGHQSCANAPRSCELRLIEHQRVVDRASLIFRQPTPTELPTLSVSPNRGLLDDQIVEVRVGGADRGFWVAQCVVAELGDGAEAELLGCGSGIGNSGESGADVTVELQLSRSIGGFDCAEDNGRCRVILSSQHRELVFVPLRFDPEGPIPDERQISVRPRRNLVDGQEVTVTALDLSGHGEIRQCAVVKGELARGSCVNLGHIENYPTVVESAVTIVRVFRELRPGGVTTPWDCASVAGACVLLVEGYDQASGTELSSRTALRFDPEGPAPAAPGMSITPRRGLIDRQAITVELAGIIRGARVDQCALDDSGVVASSCRSIGVQIPDGARAVTASGSVYRYLYNGDTNEQVDCATRRNTCAIVSEFYGQPDVELIVTLSFRAEAAGEKDEGGGDEGGEGLPPGNESVSASVPAPGEQEVTIYGAGWPPGLAVFILPCPGVIDEAAATGDTCDTSQLTPAAVGADGTFVVTAFWDIPAEGLVFAAGDPASTAGAVSTVLVQAQ